MKHGCLTNLFFALLLVVAFIGSTYFWFTWFVKGRSLPTPNLIGKTIADARATCLDLGVNLDVRPERRNSDKVPVDRVVWQIPTAGATDFIKRGTSIRVELSAGPLVLRVPDLAAQSGGTSILRLGQLNLIVGVPPMPPSYVMPDIIDQPLDQIRPALEAHGLIVSTVKYETYPGIRDGIIIRQYPLRGAPVSSRDPITVVVTRQEENAIVEQTPVAATATH